MAEKIGEGYVEIRGDDSQLERTLAKAEAEFKRTMDRIDREHAEVSIGADLSDLKRDIKAAEAELRRFEQRRANKNLTASERNAALVQTRALDDQLAKMRQQLNAREKAVAEEKKLGQEFARNDKILAATAKREETYARAQERHAKQREAAIRREAAVRERADRATEQARTRLEAQAKRADALRQREIDNIPKMQAAYARLEQRINRLNQAKQRLSSRSVSQRDLIDIDVNRALADMRKLEQRLKGAGGDVIHLRADVVPGRDFGVRLRRELEEGMRRGGVTRAARNAGLLTGLVFTDSIAEGIRRTASIRTITSAAGSIFGKVGRGLESLSEATIRLGPFTTSIRTAMLGLSLLGPVLVDIVGTLGALVGVVGSAALGLGALALGASGVLLGLGGIFALTKPLLSDFKNLNAISKAASKAALQYGANSKQAADAQKKLNEALKNADPATRSAFKNLSELRKNWGRFVEQARGPFNRAMSETFKTLNSDVGVFGKRSVEAFKVASKGWQGWMKGLRSPEAKHILSEVMDNANQAMGPLMHGLGALAAVLGRIARIASREIPGIARTFDTWASEVENASENTGTLERKVHAVIDSAERLGRFLLATGRLLKTFFGGGVDAGNDLLTTMTNIENRWNRMLSTPQGQADLHKFFQQSVEGASQLVAALAPVIASFVRWSIEIAPLARMFFQGAAAVGNFVSSILKLTALRGPVSAMVATLGGLWAINKIGAATRALTGFSGALLATERAGAATVGGSSMMGVILGGGGKGKAAGAAREVGLLRNIAEKAIPAIAGLGAVTGGAATLGLAALAGAAAYGTYKLLTMKGASDKLRDSITNSLKPIKDLADAVGQHSNAVLGAGAAQRDYNISQRHVTALQEKLNRLERQGKTNSDEYIQTQQRLRDALTNRAGAEKNLTDNNRRAQQSSQKMIDSQDKLRKVNENVTKSQKQYADATKELDLAKQSGDWGRIRLAQTKVAEAQKNVNLSTEAQREAYKRLQPLIEQSSIDFVNYQRVLKGMIPAAGAAARSLAALYRANSRVGTKVATQFEDPKQAGRVAQAAGSALKAGAGQRVVLNVVANTRNAELAIRRLAAVRDLRTTLTVVEHGGKEAVSLVERLKGAKLDAKTQAIIMKGGGQAIQTLARILGIKLGPKTQRLLERGGSGVIGQLMKILGIKLPNKNVTVTANTSAAYAGLISIQGLLAALHDKTIRVSTISAMVGGATGRARGRHGLGRETSLVGEGLTGRGAHELIANQRTGNIASVDRPTLMKLDKDDFVIPTEAALRARGAALFTRFVQSMGVPSFAGGRKPTKVNKPVHGSKLPLSAAGLASARGVAARGIKAHHWQSKQAKPYMDAVEAAKTAESDQEFQIGRSVGKLKEPSTFLKKVGEDQDGNDILALDDAEIQRWTSDLTRIGGMYDQLLLLIDDTEKKIDDANGAMNRIIASTKINMKALQRVMRVEKRIMNARNTSKSEKQAATQRHKVYEDRYNAEQGIQGDAFQDRQDLVGEKHDVGQRRQTAGDERDQYYGDAAAVAGTAEAELAGQTDRNRPTAPPTPLESAQGVSEALDAAEALASIGQGVAPTDSQKIAAQQAIITAAQGMLNDTDPSNDSTAYGAIISAAGVIKGIQDTATASAQQVYSSHMNLDSSRYDLFKNMGNNFSVAGGYGATSGIAGGGFGPSGAAAPSGGGPVINQVFYQMPDPHTWSQGIAFELHAAL